MKNLHGTPLMLAVLVFGLTACFATSEPEASTPATVVDIVVESDAHTTLEAAVLEADLAGALSAEGPFTVFAPTDDAFAAALEALDLTAEELLASPDLADILTFHVVPGRLLAEDVVAAIEAGDGMHTETTLQGEELTFTLEDGMVLIEGDSDFAATVATADLEAGNGVVHVVDGVLLPESAR